ncbi:MAG: ThiF family adenylyltransferase [Bacilli bacterium]|nr:ThiF family adenylyltransferase [Bacilli bacterium]
MWLDRLNLLIDTNKLQDKCVLIIGIGGVGGYALEAICRSGVNNIIIIDNDTIDVTNLNRQIITNLNNIGNKKIDEAKKRILSINDKCNVTCYDLFLDENNIYNIIDNHKIDYIIDACDTISVKKELIRISKKRNIKLITSMGTANKMHPELLEIIDIRKTEYDPVAKILRKMVKDEKIKGKVMCVSSKEQGIKNKKLGSNAFTPATAGLLLASYVINDMVGNNE